MMLIVGMYKGGQFKFTFNINPNYPHEPPKVLCTQKVFHLLSLSSWWWLTIRSITQISIYQGISVCKFSVCTIALGL